MLRSKVFGVGFSKTGTTSLEKALEILGYRVCRGHWKNPHTFYLLALYIHGDYEEILRISRYYDGFADGPWGGTDLYLKLLEWYPDAKFILTVRDGEKWYGSFEKLICMFDEDLDTALSSYHANGMYGSEYAFRRIFGIERLAGNRDRIIETYLAHNHAVQEELARRGADHLVIDMTDAPGWGGLCEFLNVEQPGVPFPHANKSIDNPYVTNERNRSRSWHSRLARRLLHRVARK